jgi:CxxC motif-containing protein
MTQEELRTEYIGRGYTVEPVETWILVSKVDGVEKYDVNVITPDNRFVTAQVVVRDGEAEATGVWKEVEMPESFEQRLRVYIRTLEGGTVFAIALDEVKEADSVATATAYMSDGSKKRYVVKERDNTFSNKELI